MIRGDRGFAAIPTNDGLTLVVVGCPFAQAGAFRADVEGNFMRTLDTEAEFAEPVRAATREEWFVGGGVPTFVRKPYGAGWALVGDAAYTKDPITAQGITDAFRSAEAYATTIDEAFTGARSHEDAMERSQQERDARAMPIFEYTTQLATLEPPPPEVQ